MPPSSSGGGGGGDGSGASKRHQAGDGGGSRAGGSNALSPLREHSASGKLGTPAALPRRRVQGNVKNGSATGLVAVRASSSSSSSLAGSVQDSGSGSTALVAVDDTRSE